MDAIFSTGNRRLEAHDVVQVQLAAELTALLERVSLANQAQLDSRDPLAQQTHRADCDIDSQARRDGAVIDQPERLLPF